MPTDAIVLAAGKGLRMRSERPKVLARLAGRPLLAHVLKTAFSLPDARVSVVVGHGAAEVEAEAKSACKNPSALRFVKQREQLGTGHAARLAAKGLSGKHAALVLFGDVPLLKSAVLRRLLVEAESGKLALLTAVAPDPQGYGRILRAPDGPGGAEGEVTGIVEERDASAAQRRINEINTGVLAAPLPWLKEWLAKLDNDNAQGEFYLTDVVAMACAQGRPVVGLNVDFAQARGVNSRAQLAQVERQLQRELACGLMERGAQIADPERLDVRGEVQVASDVFIDVNVVLAGKVRIGAGASIGAGCVIQDCTIGPGAQVKPHSVLEGAKLAANCEVGPFARLRPGTRLADGASVGNFVEVKNASVGAGSKASHLSYIGDATVGEQANIGAGAITCNFDGRKKHRTTIGAHAFVGSNATLVAPVAIGQGATVGAGSTITKNVPQSSLGVGRGKQHNVSGWKGQSGRGAASASAKAKGGDKQKD